MSQAPEEARAPKEQRFVGMPGKITKLVETESDRGAILILTAYLEEILGLIVSAACVTDEDADKILEFRGPAGGFDLKIQLCKALALIHPRESQGLQAVRKIRNCAAHFDDKRGFDVLFDSQQTMDHVANLATSQNLVMTSREGDSARELFTLSVRLLATKLYWRLANVRRPQPLATVKETANALRERYKDTDMGKVVAEIEAAGKDDPEVYVELFKSMLKVLNDRIAGHEAEKLGGIK